LKNGKPVINQSRVQAWRNCRQAFHYKYVEKIVPVRTPRPFAFGTIVHQILEASINSGQSAALELLRSIDITQQGKIFKEEKEYYGDILEDIRIIMHEYFLHWKSGELTYQPVGPKKSEITFQLETKRFIAEGTIDAIARTPNGLVWLVEHKTHGDLPSEDHRWRNVQSSVYLTALQKLKIAPDVSGIVWNYISSKSPTIPEYLGKSGRLSRREIVTLPSVVRAQLQHYALSVDDNLELIESAYVCRQRYFQRIYTPLSPSVQSQIWQGFVDTAHEIIDNPGRRDKNITRACEWCSYEPLCRAELTGGDLAAVKKNEFQPDPKGQPTSDQSSRQGGHKPASARSGGTKSPSLRVIR
jgi:hypothetical protein